MDDQRDIAASSLSALLRQFSTCGSITQGTVTQVDKTNNICTIEIEDSQGNPLELNNVPIKTLSIESNFIVYPKVGTDCSVCFYGGSLRSPALLDFQDADSISISGQTSIEIAAEQITLNEGNLGGLINIATMTQKLNDFIQAFNDHTHQVTGVQPGSGSVTAPAPTGKASPLNASDYEDTKITH